MTTPNLPRKLLDVACRIRTRESLHRDDELVDEAAHAIASRDAEIERLRRNLGECEGALQTQERLTSGAEADLQEAVELLDYYMSTPFYELASDGGKRASDFLTRMRERGDAD